MTVIKGGPVSTDNAGARYDGTAGTLQNSALVIADTTADLSRTGDGGIDVQATNTNDNAPTGYKGEHIETTSGNGNATATVTMTIAAPCVVTWTGHGFTVGACTTAIKFTTTGALPTGVVSGTTYYVKAIDADTFNIATSADNALAGTFITTSGSQSGVHTGDIRITCTSTVFQNTAAISLGAGDWMVMGSSWLFSDGAVTGMLGSLTTTSATRSNRAGRLAGTDKDGLTPAVEFDIFQTGPSRFSLSNTTTIYLVSEITFTGGSTAIMAGYLQAWRPR